MRPQIFSHKTIGQSLSEYSLVMGLVALACIGGVAVLGTQIQNQLGNSLGTSPVQTAVTNPTTLNALAAPFSKQQGFFLTSQEIQQILAQSPTETLDLGNGKKITIPKPNFPELQETLGPNGSTEVAIALLNQLRAEMKAQGIDPDTIPELAHYAQAAHQMSQNQKLAERLLADPLKNRLVDDKVKSEKNELLRNLYIAKTSALTDTHQTLKKGPNNELIATMSYDAVDDDEIQLVHEEKSIESLSLSNQLMLLENSAINRINASPETQNLSPTFQTIAKTVSDNTTYLRDILIGTKTVIEKNGEGPVWLSTKIQANKSCIMSKDQSCLK